MTFKNSFFFIQIIKKQDIMNAVYSKQSREEPTRFWSILDPCSQQNITNTCPYTLIISIHLYGAVLQFPL